MFELLFLLLTPLTDCSLGVGGKAEVYFVAHYGERDPKDYRVEEDRGNFTLRSPLYTVEDQTIEANSALFPVAYQWFIRPDRSKEYHVAKTCGTVPHPCACDPWDGVVADPEECSITVQRKQRAYLVAYYLHEDPEMGGIRYAFESKPVKYKKVETVEISTENYPEAIEWFVKLEGFDDFVEAGVCGVIPGGP